MFESFGIDDSGFRLPTFADVQAEVRAELGARLGYAVTDETTLAGILADVFAEALLATWEAHYDTWISFQLGASGASLRNVMQQVGIYPRSDVQSTGTVNLVGTVGFPVPAGSVFRDVATGDEWETLASGYADTPLGDAVAVRSVEPGPIAGGPGGTYETVSDVPGWDTVVFVAEALPGTAAETDTQLRERHASTLTGVGKTLAEGVPIRTRVLTAPGVTDATVELNDTGVVVDGINPYSMRVIVQGGADLDVATAIWNSKRLGGGTTGAIAVVVVDEDGGNHTINFSRPTLVGYDVHVSVNAGPGFPADGTTQIKDLVAAYAATLGIGSDVSHPQLYAKIAAAVPGIINMGVSLGAAGGPTTPDTFSIDFDELSELNDVSVGYF